ncbi:MAG TPA: glycoside hydrolase family 3 C-terminal domain-containing protein, partial [Terriglobia bacterium]|nr:glycoside hydrolase family 3 C-terminal domain-containing protein [Terriglobia bacterium]
PMKAFSVRWTGTITPPGAGDYTFGVNNHRCFRCEGHEIFKVYLDGKLVIDSDSSNRQSGPSSFTTHFANASPHDLRVDYSHQSPLFGAGAVFNWKPPVEVLREKAVRAANQADVVVAIVGLSPHLEGEEMPIHIEGFNGGDRTNIILPAAQQDLLKALAATGKPLVVVLMNGSALAVNWAEQHAAAILEAWYPGEDGGTAIAETLAGANNPAGRLPITFYSSLSQLPPFEDYSMQNRTYRYFHGKPLYTFGYGLSYSSFTFNNIRLSAKSLRAGQPLTVKLDVRNTSQVAGDEVAELYLTDPPSETAPIRALKGFERIHLAPGESKTVVFTVSPRDLSQVTEKGERRILPGAYSVYTGGSQPGTGSEGVGASFTITGEQALPR